jgi:hypothetical protein
MSWAVPYHDCEARKVHVAYPLAYRYAKVAAETVSTLIAASLYIEAKYDGWDGGLKETNWYIYMVQL